VTFWALAKLGQVDPLQRTRTDRFERFFARKDTFTWSLQWLPDGFQSERNHSWCRALARFVRNRGTIRTRLALVRVAEPSVLLQGSGSLLPIAVAHGEGRAEFASVDDACPSPAWSPRVCRSPRPSDRAYPENQTGSPRYTALTTPTAGHIIIPP